MIKDYWKNIGISSWISLLLVFSTFCTQKKSVCIQDERLSLLFAELFFFNLTDTLSYSSIIIVEKNTLDTFEVYQLNTFPDQIIKKNYSRNRISSVEKLNRYDSLSIFSYWGDHKYSLLEKTEKLNRNQTHYFYLTPDSYDTLYSGIIKSDGCNKLDIKMTEYYYENTIRKEYKNKIFYSVDYKDSILIGTSNGFNLDKIFYYDKNLFVDSISYRNKSFIVRYE